MSAMSGNAWVYGDNIDTDLLAPGAYMKGSIEELAAHCLEEYIQRSHCDEVTSSDSWYCCYFSFCLV